MVKIFQANILPPHGEHCSLGDCDTQSGSKNVGWGKVTPVVADRNNLRGATFTKGGGRQHHLRMVRVTYINYRWKENGMGKPVVHRHVLNV